MLRPQEHTNGEGDKAAQVDLEAAPQAMLGAALRRRQDGHRGATAAPTLRQVSAGATRELSRRPIWPQRRPTAPRLGRLEPGGCKWAGWK